MMDRGPKLTIGSDDPPLHVTDPVWCNVEMVNKFGATLDDVRGFVANSIVAARVPDTIGPDTIGPDTIGQDWRREWLNQFDDRRRALSI